MKCKNCGTENAPMTAFCGVCGTPLEGNEFQLVPVNASVENYSDANNQPPKKKKKGLKIAIIIISIVLALTIVGVAIIGVGLAVAFGLFKTDADEEIYTPDVYEDSVGENIYEEEFDFDSDDFNAEDFVDSYLDENVNYADYIGYYYTIDGFKENGPCYYISLTSFEDKQYASFSVEYVGVNVSPYYATESISVSLDADNSADFEWSDSWGNSGTGTIQFVEGAEPTIKLEMVQTETSDFNRYSLQTAGTIELYYGE
ncbi:MAG: zinc ribbon domain-containing protein [Clostridia bacterium]|nr:zinc ribbon domain-containing protein [Clostridia bacterium]